MSPITAQSAALQAELEQQGFAFVHSGEMRQLLTAYGSLDDWHSFAESWNRLELDAYMADGGRYRRRRHAIYRSGPGTPIARQPHQPHFQAVDYNPLNGGIERWFEPIEPQIGGGATMTTILAFCRALFEGVGRSLDLEVRPSPAALKPRTTYDGAWQIELHQFRIEARVGEHGRPTPEGLHRDGVDYVLVLLVSRQNIASGVTSIHALDGRPLGQFTLTDPLDAALVDDTRVAHGVTPVEPIDPAKPAHRDVLVVTFRADASRA